MGISSTSQAEADQASDSWGIAFPLLADPSCTLVHWWNETGLLESDIKYDESVASADTQSAVSSDRDEFVISRSGLADMQYAVGMLQPAALALRGAVPTDSPLDGTTDVLYTWGLVPSIENVMGATGRVPPSEVWSSVQLSLSGDYSQSRPAQPPGVLTSGSQRLMFHLMLLARGNFVTLKPFLNNADNDYNLEMGHEQPAIAKKIRVVGLVLAIASLAGLRFQTAKTVAAWVVSRHIARTCTLYYWRTKR